MSNMQSLCADYSRWKATKIKRLLTTFLPIRKNNQFWDTVNRQKENFFAEYSLNCRIYSDQEQMDYNINNIDNSRSVEMTLVTRGKVAEKIRTKLNTRKGPGPNYRRDPEKPPSHTNFFSTQG